MPPRGAAIVRNAPRAVFLNGSMNELRQQIQTGTALCKAATPGLRQLARQWKRIAEALDVETPDLDPHLRDALALEGRDYAAALEEISNVTKLLRLRSRRLANLVWAHTPKKAEG